MLYALFSKSYRIQKVNKFSSSFGSGFVIKCYLIFIKRVCNNKTTSNTDTFEITTTRGSKNVNTFFKSKRNEILLNLRRFASKQQKKINKKY